MTCLDRCPVLIRYIGLICSIGLGHRIHGLIGLPVTILTRVLRHRTRSTFARGARAIFKKENQNLPGLAGVHVDAVLVILAPKLFSCFSFVHASFLNSNLDNVFMINCIS